MESLIVILVTVIVLWLLVRSIRRLHEKTRRTATGQTAKIPKRARIRELMAHQADASLSYALRISEIVPNVTKLDTLASRYNVTHCGAGGSGLLAAQTSRNYQAVAEYLRTLYLERFAEIGTHLIGKAGHAAAQRKTARGKLNVWLKLREQIESGADEFQYDLPDLSQVARALVQKVDEEIAALQKSK